MPQAPALPPTTIRFDAGAAKFRDALTAAWKVPPRLQVWEVAEDHRRMPSDLAKPGRYSEDVTPWTREIQERLHPDDPTQFVVFEGASQAAAKSKVGLNWFMSVAGGYYPGKMIIALDTLENARDFARDDLDEMISLSPLLRERVREAVKGSKGETVTSKWFPGGRCSILGMHSENSARRRAAKWIWLDELDGGQSGNEGDVVELFRARQSSFGNSAKMLLTSSPTEEGSSQIHKWFLKGDQNLYHVPCPRCGERQPLEWEDPNNETVRYFLWDTYEDKTSPLGKRFDASSARYRCRHCGHEFQEQAKSLILPAGLWVPSNPGHGEGIVRSYNVNALYAATGTLPWPELVRQWYDALCEYKTNGDPQALTSYVNTRKAKVFAPPGQVLDANVLASHVDPTLHPDKGIPAEIQAVTGGTDVQHESVYTVTIGIGPGWEVWILDACRIDRCPEDSWVEHDLLINHRFPRVDGQVSIPKRWCIDSRDHGTETTVLEYTDPRFGRGVYAIKGTAEKDKDGAIWETKIKGDVRGQNTRGRWFTVHTVEAKNWLYDALTNPNIGPRYVHIAPHIVARYPDFLDHLTAEKREREKGTGRWVWTNKAKRPNHFWDALVYALAAAHSIKMAFPQAFMAPAVQVQTPSSLAPATVPAAPPSVRLPPPRREPDRWGGSGWSRRPRGR